MSDKVSITVSGQVFEGWKTVSISRSLKTLSGSFDLSVTDRWSADQTPIAIRPGDPCEIKISGELLITGFVDQLSRSISAGDKTFDITGRDKTSDLVDCSVDIKERQFSKISVLKIAEKLCKPFGISVSANASIGQALPTWSIQEGETVFENIQRACRIRNLLAIATAKGELILMRPSGARASSELVEGKNILEAGSRFDASALFSKYIVRGQNQLSQDDDSEPDTPEELATEGSSTDLTVKRYRPLVINHDSKGSNADAKRRAQWEATIRQARSIEAEVTVQGWRQVDGRLWQVGEIVKVTAPSIGIQSEMLISELDFTLDENGTKTKLRLEMPKAYLPEPEIKETGTLWGELSKVQ